MRLWASISSPGQNQEIPNRRHEKVNFVVFWPCLNKGSDDNLTRFPALFPDQTCSQAKGPLLEDRKEQQAWNFAPIHAALPFQSKQISVLLWGQMLSL